MIKKIVIAFFTLSFLTLNVYSATDKFSEEYLKNKSHFSPMNRFAESMVERGIKKALKKETGANFDVQFSGYTLSSMKKGIFKYLEITGVDVENNDIILPYVHLKSLSDYNYIDYKKNPIEFKSDMTFQYDIELSEDSINKALQEGDYQKIIKSVNLISGPLFEAKGVRTKIVNSKMYIIMDYNFPIIKASKDRMFIMTSDFIVEKGRIKAKNVHIDSSYGKISLNKVTNLINLLNPLEFTLNMLDNQQCQGKIENMNIVDNRVKVSGKIYVKGE